MENIDHKCWAGTRSPGSHLPCEDPSCPWLPLLPQHQPSKWLPLPSTSRPSPQLPWWTLLKAQLPRKLPCMPHSLGSLHFRDEEIIWGKVCFPHTSPCVLPFPSSLSSSCSMLPTLWLWTSCHPFTRIPLWTSFLGLWLYIPTLADSVFSLPSKLAQPMFPALVSLGLLSLPSSTER